MITAVTKEELELHNSVYASIQLKHPDLSEAQLSWLEHTIWKFMIDDNEENILNYNTIYNECNTYTTMILKNPLFTNIYSKSKVKNGNISVIEIKSNLLQLSN